MHHTSFKRSTHRLLQLAPALMKLSIIMFFSLGVLTAAALPVDARPLISPEHNIRKALPKTKIDHIDCASIPGICEISAGDNIFYADRSGRYLLVGRIFDTKRLIDVTSERLLRINPDAVVRTSAAKPDLDDPSDIAHSAAGRREESSPLAFLPPNSLPPLANAVVWGPADGTKVTLFADPRCTYCRAARAALQKSGARVTEYIVPVLSSPAELEIIWCAPDRILALNSAYLQGLVKPALQKCDAQALLANRQFFDQHKLSGTPVLVRADNAVMEGFQPDMLQWLKGAPHG